VHVRFELDPLTAEPVRGLVATHLAVMHAQSPQQSVHALEIDGLQGDDVRFWSVWVDDELVGCGALKRLSDTEAEIKSMHVQQQWRGKGLAQAILRHLEAQARRDGVERLSLETGSQDTFEPARRLYASFGYVECGPFATYVPDPNSTFMTKRL
jgi:putative acetyltransferase